jgi:excisionase family DNA binding protein
MPGLISPANLAKRLDCSKSTIYRMIGKNELPVRRVGGMIRIPLDAVEAIERGICQESRRDIGSTRAQEESGVYAGPIIVEKGPVALAREAKRRRSNS